MDSVILVEVRTSRSRRPVRVVLLLFWPWLRVGKLALDVSMSYRFRAVLVPMLGVEWNSSCDGALVCLVIAHKPRHRHEFKSQTLDPTPCTRVLGALMSQSCHRASTSTLMLSDCTQLFFFGHEHMCNDKHSFLTVSLVADCSQG